MKKILYILLIPIFYFSLLACPPDPGDKPCPPFCDPIDTTDTIRPILPYDLVWQIPLFQSDTQYSITSQFNTSFINDKILATKKKGWSYNEIVVGFDTVGKRLWEWEDYIKSPNDFHCSAIYSNNSLYVTTGREVHAIDINTGNTQFQTREEQYYPRSRINYTSGKLYHVWDDIFSIGNNRTTLVSFDEYLKQWKVEYTVESKDSFDVQIFPPSSWINNNGDTILVLFDKKYKTINENLPLRVDLHSYNATTDTVLWIAKHIDHSAFALPNVNNPPIIDGDRIYFFMQTIAYCFDKYTGEILWQTKYVHADGDGTGSCNYILAGDKLYSVSDQGYVFAIDKNTGQLVFRKDYGGFTTNITYYDGKLYYTDTHLLIVDAKTGGLLHDWRTHNYSERTPGAFSNGVAINPEQGVMYVQDGFFLMCIKIPE